MANSRAGSDSKCVKVFSIQVIKFLKILANEASAEDSKGIITMIEIAARNIRPTITWVIIEVLVLLIFEWVVLFRNSFGDANTEPKKERKE